jgi:hypothetical protein
VRRAALAIALVTFGIGPIAAQKCAWYYWLKPGDRFDLSTWRKLEP